MFSFPPGAPPRRGGVFCFCSFGAPCSSKTPPPRPLTLASSLRMGPLGAGACCCAALAKGSARCAMTYGRRSSSSAAHTLIAHATAVRSPHTLEMITHDDTRENARTQRVRKKIRSRATRYEAATAVVCLKEKHHLAARSRTRSQGKVNLRRKEGAVEDNHGAAKDTHDGAKLLKQEYS